MKKTTTTTLTTKVTKRVRQIGDIGGQELNSRVFPPRDLVQIRGANVQPLPTKRKPPLVGPTKATALGQPRPHLEALRPAAKAHLVLRGPSRSIVPHVRTTSDTKLAQYAGGASMRGDRKKQGLIPAIIDPGLLVPAADEPRLILTYALNQNLLSFDNKRLILDPRKAVAHDFKVNYLIFFSLQKEARVQLALLRDRGAGESRGLPYSEFIADLRVLHEAKTVTEFCCQATNTASPDPLLVERLTSIKFHTRGLWESGFFEKGADPLDEDSLARALGEATTTDVASLLRDSEVREAFGAPLLDALEEGASRYVTLVSRASTQITPTTLDNMLKGFSGWGVF